MLSEQLLHAKKKTRRNKNSTYDEKSKTFNFGEWETELTGRSWKRSWGNVLSLPRCLSYASVTNQAYVLVKILFVHFIIYKFNLN